MEESIYKNRKIVLLTKHKKEEVIQPLIENATECQLIVESRYDTDQFGTFSREIKRPQSQVDTARLKVKKGMELSNTQIGIASEGSFGPNPIFPMPWNVEVVILYDKNADLEIVGICENSNTNFSHLITDKYEEALNFAEKIGFPEHYLILRTDNRDSKKIIKDINCYDRLKGAFHWCVSKSSTGQVFIETDMRAHANPTRMKNIKKATEDLLQKLTSYCPNCQSPGFIVRERIGGLPCEYCKVPTGLVMKNISKCTKCNFEQEVLFPNGNQASAQYCEYCNP